LEVAGIEPASPEPSVRILRAQPVSGLGRTLVTGDPANVPASMVVSRRGSRPTPAVSRSWWRPIPRPSSRARADALP